MVISVRSYADFVLAAKKLRNLDAVFYKDSTTIIGNTYGVAYAIDYHLRMSVALQVAGGITFSTTDFPTAIAIGDHMLISEQSALSGDF